MQWVFNLLYKMLDGLFSLLGSIPAPSWVSDLTLAITKYINIANFYLPIDTLFTVAISVLAVTVIMMIVSAVLQIF